MRFPSSHLQTLAITCLFTLTTALPATVIKREEDLKSSYDYIIVGGGTSGLVIANRLTEDPKTTVLVIEAEFHLSKKMKSFPGYVGRTGAKYEWGYNTSAISGLNDRKFRIPAAKVVGGGSVINGMFYTRGSKEDYDSWEKLGNPGWGWEDLRKWFNKSETFHRQPEDSGVTFDLSTHGTTGPIQTSYPPLRYPQLQKIINAMKSFGIPTALDGTNGHSLGKFWVLNTLDPRNQTQANYHLITQRQVTKIIFENDRPNSQSLPRALRVLYSIGRNKSISRLLAKKEVILAAGAIHTPKLLQLSGIGDSRLLKSAGIKPIVDLPGVSQNFQGHAVIYDEGSSEPRSLLPALTLSPMENIASFLPLPLIAGDYQALLSSTSAADTLLPAGTHSTVLAGYLKQKDLLLFQFVTNETAPLSRDFISIRTSSPWYMPKINHRTLSHPLDLAITQQAVSYAVSFMTSEGMKEFKPVPLEGAEVGREEWVRRNMGVSFAHPCCTAKLGRREDGGVVDTKLRVHGVKGLRVVHASVIPVLPGSHLVSRVNAVAERAVELILE
ncbi:hypothetical protein FPQ18DRAFT_371288 [Pyronema domesticum]|nr:hypothetical protein FPQ18DRAFT_371288 [Pyronema domesticum]